MVRLRPYTLFTNQLGAPLELRQAGGDESKTLHSWDWQTAFSFQAIQDPLQLQVDGWTLTPQKCVIKICSTI